MQWQWEKQLIQSIEYNSTSSCTLHHAIRRTLFNRLFGATIAYVGKFHKLLNN
jgi:ABC-type sulfate transport system permease component